jgi:hypothetical protein
LIKAIITKKNQDPLLPQNTKDDEKKSSKYKNIESKKKLQKKIHKIRLRKKINKNHTKPKKLAARGGSPQPHSSINRAEKISNLDDVHNSL